MWLIRHAEETANNGPTLGVPKVDGEKKCLYCEIRAFLLRIATVKENRPSTFLRCSNVFLARDLT